MEARNKKIEDWFAMVKQGQVVLPRFQRHEAWRYSQVVGLLENILRDPPLPIGALLTLEVGDEEALRQRVAKYDIPFLSLSSKTGRDTALDVFIKMNTSATPLKDFDIVVAQLESATGDSLHDMVEELVSSVPAARDYGRIEDIILSVAALLMDRPPLKKTYLDTAYGNTFASVWDRLKHGFKHGIEFLRSEAILNEQCLPSEVAVYLICALWADVPEHDFDKGGNARTLIRKALWRAA